MRSHEEKGKKGKGFDTQKSREGEVQSNFVYSEHVRPVVFSSSGKL